MRRCLAAPALSFQGVLGTTGKTKGFRVQTEAIQMQRLGRLLSCIPKVLLQSRR
jgi:hypothetical protein